MSGWNRLGIVVGLFIASACGGDGDVDGESPVSSTCSGGKCDSTGFEVIAGGIWASCGVEVGETEDSLNCELFAEGEPVGPSSIQIDVRGVDGGYVATHFAMHADPSRDHVAQLPKDRYPLTLEVELGFHNERKVNGFQALRLGFERQFDSADAQFVIEQPFDVWPVQIATRDDLFILEAETIVAENEYLNRDGEPRSITLRPALIGRNDTPAIELVPVPRGATELTMNMRVGATLTELTTTLDGPGRWVATTSGLRLAGDEDTPLFGETPEPTEPIEPNPEPTPACTLDYLTWLGEFEAALGTPDAQLLVDELECRPVGAPEYTAWHQLLSRTLRAALPNEYAGLDDQEAAQMQLLLAAAPDSEEATSYSEFLAEFEHFYRWYAPNEYAGFDEREAAVMDVLAASRPESVKSDAAYLEWLAMFEADFDEFVPNEYAAVGEGNELDRVSRLTAIRPAAESGAYAQWFARYDRHFTWYVPNEYAGIDEREVGVLRLLTAVAPKNNAVDGYAQWLTRAIAQLRIAGSAVDERESHLLRVLAEAKPCVDDPAQAQILLDTEIATVTAHADLMEELAQVNACEP